MLEIISTNKLTLIEPVIFILFALNFLWVSMAFWTSIIGFILCLLNKDPLTLKSKDALKRNNKLTSLNKFESKDIIIKHTALVMPIYNEDPVSVAAGIESTLTSLIKTGESSNFDFYILSDTTKNDIAEQEKTIWLQLKKRLSTAKMNIFYRRRQQNNYRKVGNIADFCQRWGSLYDYMLVLDADSVMDGKTITGMVKAMQTIPTAGLMQTVPRPIRQQTFFGRFLQFAAELHSPLLASGNSFWQTDTANYWGHNAIIRIDAFMENCCLPYLTGQPPFGGEILSHDFVEAALLKRGNWQVFNITDVVGSYEEVPSNIIDFIIRDRRWAQGNLQHLRLLKTKGLHTISLFHFLSGAMSYISSLLWLILLCLGTTDAILQALNSNQFFNEPYQLFPNWHIAKPELIYSLLGVTALLLFTPKILALIIALVRNPNHFGGPAHLILSTLSEILIAILIAPVMMIFHAYFVLSTLIGANVGWKSQERNGRGIPWREALRHTLLVSLVAIIWGGLAYLYAPKYFWWLLPVLVGLVLAAPIIRYSSSIWLGKLSQKLGIFKVPSETMPSDVLESIDSYQNYYKSAEATFFARENTQAIPEEKWKKMPIQHL
ncbi:MAG: membrane glycosyltransferase [Cellvibrionaceae bacterium]|jgi:membrane glycosyltransferase